jgi:hypothetical protein
MRPHAKGLLDAGVGFQLGGEVVDGRGQGSGPMSALDGEVLVVAASAAVAAVAAGAAAAVAAVVAVVVVVAAVAVVDAAAAAAVVSPPPPPLFLASAAPSLPCRASPRGQIGHATFPRNPERLALPVGEPGPAPRRTDDQIFADCNVPPPPYLYAPDV